MSDVCLQMRGKIKTFVVFILINILSLISTIEFVSSSIKNYKWLFANSLQWYILSWRSLVKQIYNNVVCPANICYWPYSFLITLLPKSFVLTHKWRSYINILDMIVKITVIDKVIILKIYYSNVYLTTYSIVVGFQIYIFFFLEVKSHKGKSSQPRKGEKDQN